MIKLTAFYSDQAVIEGIERIIRYVAGGRKIAFVGVIIALAIIITGNGFEYKECMSV